MNPELTAETVVRWGWGVVDALVGAGVCDMVLSPGSRSSAVTLAAARHPGLRTEVVLDERDAAFFALGLAKAGRRPVALLATSGSAPAHWLPAVMEADHGRVPLLLLTADRPPELQQCGANQTANQERLFGDQVRATYLAPMPASGSLEALQGQIARLAALAAFPLAGPVHLNLPLPEPITFGPVEAPAPATPDPVRPPRRQPAMGVAQELARRIQGARGLLLVGPGDFGADFAQVVMALADRLQWPLLADPLSGLRHGPWVGSQPLAAYDAFLRDGTLPAPDWILRFGAAPVSRVLLERLSGWRGSEQLLIDAEGGWRDPTHRVRHRVAADPELLCRELLALGLAPAAADWLAQWQLAEQRARELAEPEAPLEGRILRILLQRLPAGSLLFCGNSLPIRDLDAFGGTSGRSLQIVGNRGVSGIDGNLATLAGCAAALPGCWAVGLVGDLAAIHNLGGLLLVRNRRVILIVINNAGGAIFGQLPQAQLPEFERYWLTPQRIDFQAAAALYGCAHRLVRDAAEFGQALGSALQQDGPQLIEVTVDWRESAAARAAYWSSVATAC